MTLPFPGSTLALFAAAPAVWTGSPRTRSASSGILLRRRILLAVIVVCGVAALQLTGGACPAHAQDRAELRQQAEQLLGRPVSDAEILRMIRESGLTPDQLRDRLQAAGYERGAADPYLAVLAGRADSVPEGTDIVPLVRVLTEVTEPGAEAMPSERPPRAGRVPAPERAVRAEAPPGPRIFGRELFRRATSQFVPITTGPAPPDYRLGPGDELVLVLTGDVEQAYRLTVTPEGWIVIPDVGRVFVNGLRLDELEGTLFNRLSEAYSGIQRGPEATTFFDVSLGALRTNQVYVIGEVEEPSAYQVSSLATALTALYWAGGPAENGSFRDIAVNRGTETVARIDLYDYLLRGRADEDVRLEQGDVVFVPVAERRVRIDGAVNRPGIYEVQEGEGLRDAIEFAGGTQAAAHLRHVQIARILPPEQRSPGVDRAVLDIPLFAEGADDFIPLRNGDRITVFAVLDEARNRVTVSGGVWRPGTYGVGPDTRLWDVIERAGGLLPDAYQGRAQIQRLQDDFTRRMIPVSLVGGPDGLEADNPAIEGMDQILVFARRNLGEERVVSIGGWVRRPGVYPYAEGMTVRDLVLRAGGMRTGAYVGHAEVSRVVISQARTDTLTRRFEVPLDSSYVFDSAEATDGSPPGTPETGLAPGFPLQNFDAVFIRKAPGFQPQQSVVVSGEVLLPGPYAIQTRDERLTDLIERAGGLTPEAYPAGLQLWRVTIDGEADTLTAAEIAGRTEELTPEEVERLRAEGGVREVPGTARIVRRRTRVGVDFLNALREPNGPNNVLVEPNDSIYVPHEINTIDVLGAVGVETSVLYREGKGLGYYIDQAGGYAQNADKSRTRVRYANGEVQTRGSKFLFFGGGVPDPDPGSVITVPSKPPREGRGLQTTEWVAIFTSIATATAAIIVASKP